MSDKTVMIVDGDHSLVLSVTPRLETALKQPFPNGNSGLKEARKRNRLS
jgi:hypothetical protein